MKHRAGLAFVLVGIVACLTLGVPQSTVACTGCAEPLSDVVGPADRVLLGTITSASETGGYTFAVERVLKGNAPSVVDFPPGSAIVTVNPYVPALLKLAVVFLAALVPLALKAGSAAPAGLAETDQR